MRSLFLTLVIAGALILTLSASKAFAQTGSEEQWSEWQALGEGYVARRKVPAKLNKNKSQRRFAKVQKRLARLQILQQRQLDNIEQLEEENRNPRHIRRAKRKLVTLQKRIARDQRRLAYKSKTGKPNAVWLRTGEQGLHAVPLSQLAIQLGLKSHKLRRQLQRGQMTLTNIGTPVLWHFDSDNDQVLFASEAYETNYTDQNAYRLKPGSGKSAQLMAESATLPTGAQQNPRPFRDTLHFEEEPDMYFVTSAVASEPDADYWFWDYLFSGFKDSIEVSLNIPQPSLTGSAQMRVTLRGWTDLEPWDEHQVYAELNGIPVGPTVTWDAFEEAVLVADFDQSLLNSSGDNTLVLRNLYPSGSHSGQYLDSIELEYTRMPVAHGGQIWLHQIEAGVQTVAGFNSEDIVVIESPLGEATLRHDARIELDVSGVYTVTFEADAPADYLVAERSTADTPIVQVDIPSKLKRRNNMAEYLIIAPRIFSDTAKALATHRRNRFSRIKIVWLEDIYDQFSHGLEDPFAISAFISHAYRNWRIVPSMVVLVGKGTLDHKDRMGYSDSFLPVVLTDTPWALAPSDDRLLGGNGDAPFAIGRLPITNDDEGLAYVEKVKAYESMLPSKEDYHAVLIADDPDEGGEFHFNSEVLAERLTDGLGFDSVTDIYHPQDAVRDNLILSSTWNTEYVSYDGHGSYTQAGNGSENFIKAADAELLNNGAYPIFTALSCAVGDSSRPGARSLAGALVLNPHGGAIVSMVPAGLSLDHDAQELGNAFVDNLYDGYNTIGSALMEAKFQTNGFINAFMQRTYTVLGDPAIYAR